MEDWKEIKMGWKLEMTTKGEERKGRKVWIDYTGPQEKKSCLRH